VSLSPLTDRQRETYRFLVSYLESNERPPTLMEIATGIGVRSVNSVIKLLGHLEEKGYVSREPGRSRGLRILVGHSGNQTANPNGISVPIRLLHRKSGGQVISQNEDEIVIDQLFLRGLAKPGSCFLARVSDHGSGPDGIRRGDLVLVEPGTSDRFVTGDLILVQSRDDYLARRFVDSGKKGLLRASDRTFPTLSLDDCDRQISVSGRIVAVMRHL